MTHLKNLFQKKIILVIIPIFLIIFSSIPQIYAQQTGSISVDVKYQNGDRTDFSEMNFIVFQTDKTEPYLEFFSASNNPQIIDSLPLGYKYKIQVYINNMFASQDFVNLQSSFAQLELPVPLSGGMRFDVYYNDGVTPIEGATVSIKSYDGKEWRSLTTDSEGKTLRSWLQSTNQEGDFYSAEISITENLSYEYTPINLAKGIAQDFKIITDWPSIIDNLITVNVYNSNSRLVSSSDGYFTIELYDDGEKIADSNVSLRGVAYFSKLNVGEYELRVINIESGEQVLWHYQNIILDGKQNKIDVFQVSQIDEEKNTDITSSILGCDCIAFRLDDIQDYWLNDIQIQLIEFFKERNLPLTIGIIANAFGDDQKLVNYIKSSVGHASKIEVANHGWDNEPLTLQNKQGQSQILKDANEKIRNILGIIPTTLVPPQNEFNEDTLDVLEENGITHISSSIFKGDVPPYPLKDAKIYRFPETATTGTFDGSINLFVGLNHEETFLDIVNSIEKNGFAVITIHMQEFSQTEDGIYVNDLNLEQFNELESLVDQIELTDLDFVNISEINLDSAKTRIPDWVKNNAGWWSDGLISDNDFVLGIQYLIQQSIIIVPETGQTQDQSRQIPDWVKNNAGWWSDGLIGENDFVNGIQWLISNGILRI